MPDSSRTLGTRVQSLGSEEVDPGPWEERFSPCWLVWSHSPCGRWYPLIRGSKCNASPRVGWGHADGTAQDGGQQAANTVPLQSELITGDHDRQALNPPSPHQSCDGGTHLPRSLSPPHAYAQPWSLTSNASSPPEVGTGSCDTRLHPKRGVLSVGGWSQALASHGEEGLQVVAQHTWAASSAAGCRERALAGQWPSELRALGEALEGK